MGYEEYQAMVGRTLKGEMDGDIVWEGDAQFGEGMIEVYATLLCYNPIYDKEYREFIPLHIDTIHELIKNAGLSLAKVYSRQQKMLRGRQRKISSPNHFP